MATIQTPEDLREINRKIEQRRDEIEQQKQKATTSHQRPEHRLKKEDLKTADDWERYAVQLEEDEKMNAQSEHTAIMNPSTLAAQVSAELAAIKKSTEDLYYRAAHVEQLVAQLTQIKKDGPQ